MKNNAFFPPNINQRIYSLPEELLSFENLPPDFDRIVSRSIPEVDDRFLEIFEKADNPSDPFELRDLWLGRIEYENNENAKRPELYDKWKSAKRLRLYTKEEVLSSRATVRFIKELFNCFFRDDLYGLYHSDSNIILSGGSVNEESWGLPTMMKDCIRYALNRDWYGYSDSRGRIPAREAVAAFESSRIKGIEYTEDNVALTMGATFAISSLSDFIDLNYPKSKSPVLIGVPNYPPLVEAISRRRNVQLVPLESVDGKVILEPLIQAIRPDTPFIMIQTAFNPTGACVSEAELTKLINATPSSTLILLDECHEWLGKPKEFDSARGAANVVRVSSISKPWAAPGLKVGWIIADKGFIADYYEYASTTYGGPPSFFYTMVEFLTRMERWKREGITSIRHSHIREFEESYELDLASLQESYQNYCQEQENRNQMLRFLRRAAVAGFSNAGLYVMPPEYSINIAARFPNVTDSYLCFHKCLKATNVSIYPGILSFYFSGSISRLTTSCRGKDLVQAISNISRWLK